MNGPSSKLAKNIFSQPENKKIINDRIKTNSSIVGTRVFFEKRAYIVTAGRASHVVADAKKFINKLDHEFGID